jgi:hypothetical protein
MALGVLALHAVVLIGLARSRRPAFERTVVILLPSPAPLVHPDQPREQTPAREMSPRAHWAAAAKRARRSPSASAIQPQAPEPNAGRPIDWYAQLQAAARAVVADRTRPSRDAKEGRRSGGIFSAAPTRAGTSDVNAEGELIHWFNDRCYSIVTTLNLLHRGMIRCVQPLGRGKARGDLFDHMKDADTPGDVP